MTGTARAARTPGGTPTRFTAAADVAPLSRTDFVSDQEVRWCPGCGDYAILAAVQNVLPELGLPPEEHVFISGIGCSSRFPYYLNTYGIHSVHGRAPTLATGLVVSRPDLNVWVITGDGDALSIGANHLVHALRRNVNLTILLFNNRIYGLTKGQYSPTSEAGKITKSSPVGSPEYPVNPVALALGAGATFVARTIDSNRTHLTDTLRAAANHHGAALVEILQNCPVFNDGASGANSKTGRRLVSLEHGEIIRDNAGHVLAATGASDFCFVREDEVGGSDDAHVVRHDAHAANPSHAFALAHVGAGDHDVTTVGVFHAVTRETYDDAVRRQSRTAGAPHPAADLNALLEGEDSWQVA